MDDEYSVWARGFLLGDVDGRGRGVGEDIGAGDGVRADIAGVSGAGAEWDGWGAWFAQEYLCEFVDNGSQLFGRELVEQALDDEEPLEI